MVYSTHHYIDILPDFQIIVANSIETIRDAYNSVVFLNNSEYVYLNEIIVPLIFNK